MLEPGPGGTQASVAEAREVSNCGAGARRPPGLWDRPELGMEAVAPASAGGFLTPGSPAKSAQDFSGDFIGTRHCQPVRDPEFVPTDRLI